MGGPGYSAGICALPILMLYVVVSAYIYRDSYRVGKRFIGLAIIAFIWSAPLILVLSDFFSIEAFISISTSAFVGLVTWVLLRSPPPEYRPYSESGSLYPYFPNYEPPPEENDEWVGTDESDEKAGDEG